MVISCKTIVQSLNQGIGINRVNIKNIVLVTSISILSFYSHTHFLPIPNPFLSPITNLLSVSIFLPFSKMLCNEMIKHVTFGRKRRGERRQEEGWGMGSITRGFGLDCSMCIASSGEIIFSNCCLLLFKQALCLCLYIQVPSFLITSLPTVLTNLVKERL